MNRAPDARRRAGLPAALFVTAFAVSTCGLIYELIAGTLASYLLGDSVTQFSTVIGAYLFSMGIGSWLSRHVRRGVAATFVVVEMLIGLIGGGTAALLFLLFERVSSFHILLYSLVAAIGVLVGLEIPLLMRMLKEELEFSELVAKIFTFDYVGALAASLLFPLLLVPHLGLLRTGFLFGALNLAVALWTLRLFRGRIARPGRLQLLGLLLLALQLAGFIASDRLLRFSEASVYPEPVIYSRTSAYQRIILTAQADDLRLYLNGHLQFSSRDEYRYHEALIHPGLSAVARPARVLVLGGGDGLGLREILKRPEVESVTLVDLDPEMTRLFSTQDFLVTLNRDAFHDPRVAVIHRDAFLWLRENRGLFDFIAVDFPDPTNYSVGKLYTTAFYRELGRALAPGGFAVVQSTSPLFARRSYWCIARTLEAAGLRTTPYHAYVPSFGEWGFILASRGEFVPPRAFPAGLRFLDAGSQAAMLSFPPDMARIETVEVNRLNNQALVRYYDEEWGKYAQ